jgi:uncharacterized coiled-coil protein SlyX
MAATASCGDPVCACGCGAWLGQCQFGFVPQFYSMRALSDFEDDPPAKHFRPMTDTDEPETAQTQAAPPLPETEPETQPPDPIEEAAVMKALATLLPPPKQELARRTDSYFEQAARDFAASLVEMRNTRAAIEAGFKDQEKSAKNTRAAVSRSEKSNKANYELIKNEFVGLKDSLGTFRRETEERFAALEARIKHLEERVTTREAQIAEQKEILESQRSDLEAVKKLMAEVEERVRKANASGSTEAPTATE